ncbi:MAG: hypothetical protein E5V60_24840, partial [Mesorhizobium sp.]
PLKGGDQQRRRLCQSCKVSDWRRRKSQPISPLEGEMAGRPEGGAWRPPQQQSLTAPAPCPKTR